jgi:hypothetical protein
MVPWELVAVPLGSVEHTLGSTAFAGEESLKISHLSNKVVENRHKILRAVNSKVYNECEPSNNLEQDIMTQITAAIIHWI